MQKKNFFIFAALCMALLASCAKEGPTGPTGPAGPVYYGTIQGYVSLYDKYGSEVLSGQDKASIYLSSSATGINPVSSSYSFTNIATGTYYMTATDSGYANTILYDVNFISNTLYKNIKLSAIPDSFITAFAATLSPATLTDSLHITVTADTRERSCIVFVSNAAKSGINLALYTLKYIVDIPANTGNVSLAVPQQDLLNAGLASGSLVYYEAYSYVVNDASVYADIASSNNIYNAVNATPIVDTVRVP